MTFTGDAATGDIRFAYNNIQTVDAGVCYWDNVESFSDQEKCVTLYVLGTPTNPSIHVNPKNPDKGEIVTLTCSGSSSTTQPTGHGLAMIYTWTFDGTTNPTNSRYSYSSSKQQLTINNVVSGDASKQFTCRSTEDVTDGLTSDSSSTDRFNVYYGPDNIRFSPSTTTIEQTEGTTFTPVTCTEDCYPLCTYVWTKSGNTVQNGETLDLGSLASNEAGVYRCTATNPGRTGRPGDTAIKELTVNVVYGPRNIGLSPSTTSYRREVGYFLHIIKCQADCYPSCTYSWTGPNSFSSSDNILQLGTLSKSEHGTYTCTARNTQTTSTTTVFVEVMHGPETPTLSPTTPVYTVGDGDTLPNVQCTAACFPTCTYTWTKAGQQAAISTSGTLPLGTIQKSYAGVYTCTATNQDRSGHPTSTVQITINVRYGPDSVSCSPSQTSIIHNEGTTASDISCVSDSYPDCTYTWTKSGTPVDTDGRLSLGQLTRSEAGTYTVTAVNTNWTNSPQRQWSVTVNVRYGPDEASINHQPIYTVTEGTSPDNLTCTSDCYPSCSYVWRNLTSNSNIATNGVISLANVPRYFASDYICTSSNTASQLSKTASASTKLIVNYAPYITVLLSSQDWNENSTLLVTCDAQGVPSDYTYSPIVQTFDGVSIPNNNSNQTPYNVLTISSLQLRDTGTYTCTVNNGITDITGIMYQQATKDIKVKVTPKVLDTTLRFVGTPRNHINISIPFYSYPTVTNLEIRQQNGTIVNNDNRHHVTYQPHTVTTDFFGVEVRLEGHNSVLTITTLQEEDFMAYILVITNAIGTTESTFTLEVESIPSPPKSFVFNGLENGNPSFLWEKDFNGGHTQYFTIKIGSSKDAADLSEKLRVYENTTRYILSNGTFTASIEGISPGTYYAELSTGNKIGNIPDSMALTLTFVIPNTVVDCGENTGSSSTAAVVGAACGGFVLAIVLVIVFVLVKRLRKRSSDGMSVCWFSSNVPSSKNKTDHIYDNDLANTTQQNDDSYVDVDGGRRDYNMRNNTENSHHGNHESEGQYETTLNAGEDDTTESAYQRSEYECLNRQTGDVAVYEMLKQQDTNEVEKTAYENLKLTT